MTRPISRSNVTVQGHYSVTSYLGASTEHVAGVESNAAMATSDVYFDGVPLRQADCVVGSYHGCTRATVIAAYNATIEYSVAQPASCNVVTKLNGIDSIRRTSDILFAEVSVLLHITQSGLQTGKIYFSYLLLQLQLTCAWISLLWNDWNVNICIFWYLRGFLTKSRESFWCTV